jgi:methyltransferase
MAVARLVELRYSGRNIRSQSQASEGETSRRSYPLILLLHTLVIGGTLLRGSPRPRWGWLLLLLAVQPLRLWVLATLGARWNARGVVPQAMDVCTEGPYAFVRHPNYSVVAIELASLPAAFGLGRFAVAASLVNAALLTLRVRDEEALLLQLPGYREHFATKPRFLPFLI